MPLLVAQPRRIDTGVGKIPFAVTDVGTREESGRNYSDAEPMPTMQDGGRSEDKLGLLFACEDRNEALTSPREP